MDSKFSGVVCSSAEVTFLFISIYCVKCVSANLELVDKFCYVVDMLSAEEMLMQLWRP